MRLTLSCCNRGIIVRSLLRGSAATIALLSATAPALADEAQDSSQIVVTAAGREQEVRNAPASITVINRETLEQMPYREVTDALMEVPGVTVTPGEGNSRDISIRGMAPQYTLILVDGKRLSSRESRTNGGKSGSNRGRGIHPTPLCFHFSLAY